MPALINPADLLGKILPMLIPPVFLIRDKQFPDTLKVFEEIAENSPPNRSLIGLKYLYLSRITGLVWLVWGMNFALFMMFALSGFIAFGQGLQLEGADLLFGLRVRYVFAILGGLLFFGTITSFALLRVSLLLEDVCREVDRRERRAYESLRGGQSPQLPPLQI